MLTHSHFNIGTSYSNGKSVFITLHFSSEKKSDECTGNLKNAEWNTGKQKYKGADYDNENKDSRPCDLGEKNNYGMVDTRKQ